MDRKINYTLGAWGSSLMISPRIGSRDRVNPTPELHLATRLNNSVIIIINEPYVLAK